MSRRLAESLPPLYLYSLLFCSAGLAGQVSPGAPNFSAYDSHAVDAVNLMSNNILLNVPVMSKSGAFPLQYGITNNFYMYTSYGTWTPSGYSWNDNINGFGAGGGIFFINYSVTSGVLCPDGHTYTNKRTNWYIQSADGTYHYLDTAFYIDDAGCYNRSFTTTTLDDSGLTLAVDYSYTCCNFVKGLYDPSGNRLAIPGVGGQATVTDTNGNFIQSQNVSGTVTFTDTLGLLRSDRYHLRKQSHEHVDRRQCGIATGGGHARRLFVVAVEFQLPRNQG